MEEITRVHFAELDRKIRVNALSPAPPIPKCSDVCPVRKRAKPLKVSYRLRTSNPSKRLAEPLEIAKLAVYLASDDSAYVVGADFAIDGGAGAFSQLGG